MQTTDFSRIHWACRRGMLELDKLLEAYFFDHYRALPLQEQQQFIRLLSQADQDLFNWLLGDVEPTDDSFKPLIQHIRTTFTEGH